MATRRKYVRDVVVTEEKPAENVIRVSQRTMASNFVRRAIWLLSNPNEDNKEKTVHDTVILRAIDNAIPKAIIIAEVVRRRIAGLY